jgi:protein-disulfide isomerase
MKSERLIVLLLIVMVGLQGFSMYRQGAAIVPSAIGSRQGQPQRPLLRDAPVGSVVDIGKRPTEGNTKARVVLIEFSDFECPFCSRHANGVGVELDDEYVKTGKVLHVFVNNPLPVHREAKMLATAAMCSEEQNTFWKMYHQLFEKKPKEKADLAVLAKGLNLDIAKFQKCMDKGEMTGEWIDKDVQLAKSLNLGGTPSFAIGVVDDSGQVKLARLIVGAQPADVFKKEITSMLSK